MNSMHNTINDASNTFSGSGAVLSNRGPPKDLDEEPMAEEDINDDTINDRTGKTNDELRDLISPPITDE
jgi:hypothetical protein